jgi:hypothetical protein
MDYDAVDLCYVGVRTEVGVSSLSSISSLFEEYGIESGDAFNSSCIGTSESTYSSSAGFSDSDEELDLNLLDPAAFASLLDVPLESGPNDVPLEFDPNNNNNEYSLDSLVSCNPLDFSVLQNRDLKGITADNADWTKNKWRFIELNNALMQHEQIKISDSNWTKSNNKKNDSLPNKAYILEVALHSLDGPEITSCARCNSHSNVVSLSAKSQMLPIGPKIQLQVRLNCLPCYHQTSGFIARFRLLSHDGDPVASTDLMIPKVIASRSQKRRQK